MKDHNHSEELINLMVEKSVVPVDKDSKPVCIFVSSNFQNGIARAMLEKGFSVLRMKSVDFNLKMDQMDQTECKIYFRIIFMLCGFFLFE